MEKRIDFLQTNNSGKRRGHSSSASEREKIEWTSPGAAEVAREARKPGGIKNWFGKLPFFKADKKIEIGTEKILENKPEGQREKSIFRLNKSHLEKREASLEAEMKKNPVWDRDHAPRIAQEAEKKEEPRNKEPAEKKIDLAKSLKIKTPEARPEKKGGDKPKKKEEGDVRGKEWTGGGFRGTNLIKEQVSLAEVKRRVFASLALIVAAFFLLGALDYALVYWTKSKVQEKQSAVLRLESLRKEKIEKEKSMESVFSFEKKLTYAKLLLDKHIYWTSFFNFLERNTLTDVYYGNFDGDNSGSYSLNAKAKDFKSLARQVEIFRANALVKEAGASGGDYSGSEGGSKSPSGKNISDKTAGIDFQIKLILDKKIFNTLPEN